MHSEYLPLLLITALAVIVPVLASRMRIVRLPIVVGEILAGILIGRSGLNIVEPSPTLSFLAGFGFTFLMFLSGLEVSFDMLRSGAAGGKNGSTWKQPVPLALISFGLTVLLGLGVGFGLAQAGLARNPILMGLILSTTSLGIVVPILKERQMAGTRYGQAMLIAALVSDFVTLLLLSIVIAILSRGVRPDLLLFMVLLAAFAAAVKISPWMKRSSFLNRVTVELSHATAQIRVRGAFALMVFWVVLAEFLGVEVILGAFLAGAVLSLVNRGEKAELHDKLDAIGYGFFIPIFFINVGANFDLRALLVSPKALVLLPVLIISAYLVKFIPALVFRTIFSWRETLAAGALLSSRLSLIIAASAIALELDMITSATNAAVILVAVVSCMASPLLFGRILPAEKMVKRSGIVIFGTDQLAVLLGQRLRRNGGAIRFIGLHPENIADLKVKGFDAISGDPTQLDVQEQAGMGSARALICLSSDKQAVTAVCQTAIGHWQVPQVVARTDDPAFVQQLQGMGVQVIQATLAVAQFLEVALEFPTAFTLLTDHTDDVEVRDLVLTNAAFSGKALRQVRLAGNALVIGLQRNGEIIVPHGDTVMEAGDTLLLLGSPTSLLESAAMLDGNSR